MAFKATEIQIDLETRSRLEGWVRASTTEQRHVRRARNLLLAADGMASRAIAREAGVMTGIASIRRKRFAAAGLNGLKDSRGRAPSACTPMRPTSAFWPCSIRRTARMAADHCGPEVRAARRSLAPQVRGPWGAPPDEVPQVGSAPTAGGWGCVADLR
jgi:hypothetical protein